MKTIMVGSLALLQAEESASAETWPQFRGPDGNATASVAPKRLPFELNGPVENGPIDWTSKDYKWRVKLPGEGLSSPVIWGERLFVTAAIPDDGTKVIRCLRTSDGSLIWRRSFAANTYPKHANNSFASSTPVLDEKNVYMAWATPKAYTVVALDKAKGRPLWRRDLGPFVSEHGFGASPILLGDLLILANDQDGKSEVLALDRRTGETRWRRDRKTDRAAFSTPCVFRPAPGSALGPVEGSAQIIFSSSAEGVTSLDPSTGKMNWQLEVFEFRVVGSPVVCSGLVFAACGSGGGGKRLVAIRPGNPAKGAKAPAKGTKATVVYDVEKAMPYAVTPVGDGDRIFLWSDTGIVSCLEASSGKVLWRKRIGGKFFGSPVCVDGLLYCISRDSHLVVLPAEDKYRAPLAKIDLEEPNSSTPAVCDGVMYLRTASHLMAIEAK